MPRKTSHELYLVFKDTRPGCPLDLYELANLEYPKPLCYPTNTVLALLTAGKDLILHPQYRISDERIPSFVDDVQKILCEKYGERFEFVHAYSIKETEQSKGLMSVCSILF